MVLVTMSSATAGGLVPMVPTALAILTVVGQIAAVDFVASVFAFGSFTN